MTTNILTIRFSNEIRPFEVSLFRGAVINSLDQKLLLFHNHEGEKFRYDYPLIQYKRIAGKAAIVCLKQGTEDIGEFFSSNHFTLHLNDRVMEAEITSVMPSRYNVQEWNKEFDYRINRWIPFNDKNYKEFKKIEGIAEQIQFLEKILTGNILSFAKGIGIWFERQVNCKIIKLSNLYWVSVKGIKVASFNAEFKCNISLPNHIGLGKHVSIGCGTVTHKHIENENK